MEKLKVIRQIGIARLDWGRVVPFADHLKFLARKPSKFFFRSLSLRVRRPMPLPLSGY